MTKTKGLKRQRVERTTTERVTFGGIAALGYGKREHATRAERSANHADAKFGRASYLAQAGDCKGALVELTDGLVSLGEEFANATAAGNASRSGVERRAAQAARRFAFLCAPKADRS
jgi:hypothetical protein